MVLDIDMNRVQSVSIPRTGHGLLRTCLMLYFPDFRYCNFYACCQKVGCKKGADFQKNHDLDLRLPIDIDMPYIIQYRKSAQSTLNAMYRNVYLKGKFRKNRYSVANEPNRKKFFGKKEVAYSNFVKRKRGYYRKFVKKWIVKNRNPQAYYLEYYDFIDRPAYHLENIIKIFNPNDFDPKRLKKVIKKADIRLRYNLEDCPLYNKNFNRIFEVKDPPIRTN